MSVYNTPEEFLRPAIESILNQTYRHFEFIIIDDASNPDTKKVIKDYKDNRIHLIVNPINLGLTKSLNIALNKANGKYIARMDADDISYPIRLEKQLQYMEKNPSVGVLGCWTSNNLNHKIFHHSGGLPSACRRIDMLFKNNGIRHPTAFIRKSVLDENNIRYNEDMPKAQDYELWVKIMQHSEMRVYPKALMMYRLHKDQISQKSKDEQDYCRDIIRKDLFFQIYPSGTSEELKEFLNIRNTSLSIEETEQLLQKLEQGNLEKSVYDKRMFKYKMICTWTEYILPQFIRKEGVSAIFRRHIFKITERGYLYWRIKISLLKRFF